MSACSSATLCRALSLRNPGVSLVCVCCACSAWACSSAFSASSAFFWAVSLPNRLTADAFSDFASSRLSSSDKLSRSIPYFERTFSEGCGDSVLSSVSSAVVSSATSVGSADSSAGSSVSSVVASGSVSLACLRFSNWSANSAIETLPSAFVSVSTEFWEDSETTSSVNVSIIIKAVA